MYLQIEMIIKNKDVVFMEDSTNLGNNLEMRPYGRNEGPTMVIVK